VTAAAPQAWRGIAYNAATDSENRIHADDVAQRFGFRGGLVPGVTVFAYLVQPAIEAWGLDWLAGGAATIACKQPLYDGARFEVSVTPEPGARGYAGRVVDDAGVLCAEGRVWLPRELPAAPRRSGARPVPALEARPLATRAALETLRASGMGALRLRWNAEGEMARTSRELAEMPALVRPDRAAFANPAFVLGLANWVLARNVKLDAWIHAQSEVQLFAPVPLGTEITVESRVADLFEKGGHAFVDLEVAAFSEARALLCATHRAIYRLRGA
jgi:acyl dehydratase